MKKTTFAIAWLLGCTLGLSAQEAETPKPHDTKIKLSNTADGFANYYSGYYYYHGGEIFNMRNYPMFAGNKISSLRINPSGTSYAFIDNKKDKNSVDVYSLIYKDTRQGKVGTTKLFKPLAICYSPDAKFLYVMGSDKKIHIYTTRKTQEIKNFDVNETASRLDASPNGFFLIASSANKIQVINMENQSVRTTIDLKAELKDIAFSSNSKQMAVLTADGTCDVYDTKTFKVSKHFDAMGIAEKCYFHPENKYLAIVTGEQRVALLNLLNDDDRQYIDAKDAGIKYINFTKNVKNEFYLVYATSNGITFTPVGFLSPNRQEKLKDELNSRMDEWMKQMDGESLDDYKVRVNEQTRLNQMRLFETEIATNMAENLLTSSDVKLGNYNADMNMLTLDFNNMPSHYCPIKKGNSIFETVEL